MKRVLTKEQWAEIEPLLPSGAGRPGRAGLNDRQLVEGLIFKLQMGTPWRQLPKRFGPWNRIAVRYLRWKRTDTWFRIQRKLRWLGVSTLPELKEAA